MTQSEIRTTILALYGGKEEKVPPALMELALERPEYVKSLPARPPWRWRELSKESLKNVLDVYTKVIGPDGLLRAAMSEGKGKKNPAEKEPWEYFLSGLSKNWRKATRTVGKAAKVVGRHATIAAITRSPKLARMYEVHQQVKGGKSLSALELPGTTAYEKVKRKEAAEIAGKLGKRESAISKKAETELKRLRDKVEDAEKRLANAAADYDRILVNAEAESPTVKKRLLASADRQAEVVTKAEASLEAAKRHFEAKERQIIDWENLQTEGPGKGPIGRGFSITNPVSEGAEVKQIIQRFHATGPIRRAKKDEHFPLIKNGDWVGVLGKLLFVCYRSNRDHSINPYIHGFNNVFEKGQNNNEILQAMDEIMSLPGMATRFINQKKSPRLVIHTDLELFSIEAPLAIVAPKEAAYFDKHAATLASGATNKAPQIKTISAPEEDDVVGIVGDCLFFGWLDPDGKLRWFGFDQVFVDGHTPHPILERTFKSIIAKAEAGSRSNEWKKGPTLMATADQSYLLFLARMSDRGIINEDTQWLRK